MAYINKENVIDIIDNSADIQEVKSCVFMLENADVVERAQYNRVLELIAYLCEEHDKRVTEYNNLRSKIDKAVEEIANIQSHIQLKDNTTNEYWIFVDKFDVLEILKRNIGE